MISFNADPNPHIKYGLLVYRRVLTENVPGNSFLHRLPPTPFTTLFSTFTR